jgi:hypothetical protein
VKKVIELLRTACKRLGDIYGFSQTTQLEIVKETCGDIERALAELKKPASYTISDVVDVLAEARAFIEKGYADDGIDKIGAAISILDELSVPPPSWETPEQYRERTGEDWPENALVYYRYAGASETYIDGEWGYAAYKRIRGFATKAEQHKSGRYQIVCANEAGPPPVDYEPEKTDG